MPMKGSVHELQSLNPLALIDGIHIRMEIRSIPSPSEQIRPEKEKRGFLYHRQGISYLAPASRPLMHVSTCIEIGRIYRKRVIRPSVEPVGSHCPTTTSQIDKDGKISVGL